jgi:hypothetical protein
VDSLRVMSVSMGPERRAILRFSRAGTWWRVTDGARLMLVDDDLSDLFARTTDELRDRRLLQFDPSLAVHITCVLPSQSGELVRAGGRWSFPNPAAGRVNPEHAADFVRGLRALKWARPGDEASRAGGHARYYITIAGQRDTIIDELSAGPYDATTSWVTSRSSRGTWLVETARLEELAGRFARLKAR